MEANANVQHLTGKPLITVTQISELLKDWWKARAYKHKFAETVLYLMFLSGLFVWAWLDFSWQIQRAMLFVHVVAGLFVFPISVVPFWLSHRSLINRSQKKFFNRTGLLLDYLLAFCFLSGLYLVFWGAPGNDFGWLVQNIHFYTSWLLVPLVFAHALRWSVLNLRRYIQVHFLR